MNEQVKIKILGQAITARYGTLNTGDLLTTDAAFAKHLVEDCGAAEYVAAPKAPAAAGKPDTAPKKPTAKKPAAQETAPPPKPPEATDQVDASKSEDSAAENPEGVQTSAQSSEPGAESSAG